MKRDACQLYVVLEKIFSEVYSSRGTKGFKF